MAAGLVALMLVAPASAANLPVLRDAVSGLPPTGLSAHQTTCPSPRPPVRLQTQALGGGRIQATVTAGVGQLALVQFGAMQNAHIETPGSSQQYTSNSEIKPPSGVTTLTLVLVANPAPQTGQTQATTLVPITVIDGCGPSQPWSTFIGGGAQALQSAVSIEDAQVAEGNAGDTAVAFTVKLSVASSQQVTVNYTTADGTARAGIDYTAASGAVTFAPGETSKTVTVQVRGNATSEPDKTFTVALSNPANASIGRAQATGRILNDDAGAGDDTYIAVIGQTLSVAAGFGPQPGLLVNDPNPNKDAQVSSFGGLDAGGTVASNPAGSTLNLGGGGSLTVQANGSFTFTPPSTTGTIFRFQYGITSSAGASVATVTINVRKQPTVTTVAPANSATNVATNTNVVLTFSEPVHVAGAWFALACPTSGARNPGNVTVSGGPTTYTLNPLADFSPGEVCTVTVVAGQVTNHIDQQTMAANFTAQFTIDVAPQVVSTTPANGSTNIPAGNDITVTFSEPVTATTSSFAILCPGVVTYTLSASPATTFTLNPTADLPDGVTCTVTVIANQIADVDAGDPPDAPTADHVFTFTVQELAPSVVSTSPANAATNVPVNSDIVITFREPVSVNAGSFTLECPAATPFAGGFAVSGTATDTVTINPTGNLPAGIVCQVVVIAANVSDVDAFDPPDTLASDYTFSFTTLPDVAPTVTSFTPANGSTDVPSNTNLTITFSELVDITSAANFSLECGGMPQGYTVITPSTLPASAQTVVIDPASLLPDATACTVTVFAAQITDSDSDDPPDNMATNFVSTFTTEAPPSVTATTPTNGAVNVPVNSDITIDFDEPVNVSAASFTLECPSGVAFVGGFAVSGSGTATVTVNPTGDLPAGVTCEVVVVAANVSDTDALDPPDTMLMDYTFTFTTAP